MSRNGIAAWCMAALFATSLAVSCSDTEPGGRPSGAAGAAAVAGQSEAGRAGSDSKAPPGGEGGGTTAGGHAPAGISGSPGGLAGAESNDGGTAGNSGASTTEGGAGNGAGSGGEASCALEKPPGRYLLDVHNQVRICQVADLTCGDWYGEQDLSGRFDLFNARELGEELFGDLDVPQLTLSSFQVGKESWDSGIYFYYPKPGEIVDIWSKTYPIGAELGPWDPVRAGSWVRALIDVCPDYENGDDGFVHVDIEVATGRVLDFARKCDEHYATVWSEYRARGSGKLDCEAAPCNALVNSAANAQLVTTGQQEAMTGGTITSGTYALSSVRYDFPEDCETSPLPTAVRETLEIVAASATQGTFERVSERTPGIPTRSSHAYEKHGAANLTLDHRCGTEDLDQSALGLQFTASTTELRLSYEVLQNDCQNVRATYVYTKP